MKNTKVAARYAKSLMALMTERGEVDAAYIDMQSVDAVLSESKDLRVVMTSPVINKDKKINIAEAIFGGSVSASTMAFMRIIINKGREMHLAEIAEAFVALVKKSRNVLTAELITAGPVDDGIRAKIRALIAQIHSGEVELIEKINPETIGGFVLKVDDRMIDASVASKLNELRQEFLKNPYVAGF
jgi:F-type H+-transporting ATPase subunit delta